MANKPTVTLTFAGDSSKLNKAFEDVGASADKMSSRVSSTSDAARSAGDGIDSMADKADGAEGKAIGFTDTLSGLQGAFQGLNDPSLSFGERLAVLGQSTADLAGGLASFLIPALGSLGTWIAGTAAGTWVLTAAKTAWAAVTGTVTAAMTALNIVMRANPILFIVGLIAILVGAFLWLWDNSEGFRNFFIGMWDGIKVTVGAVVDWIKGAWNGMISFFTGIVNTIGNIFSGIGNAIKNAFKGAVNFVIDILNGLISATNIIIRGINLVNPFSDIPSIPKIPRLHTGGVVPGMLGSEQLAILQAGERVVPRGQAGNSGATTIQFVGNTDSAVADLIMKLVRSGKIRLA